MSVTLSDKPYAQLEKRFRGAVQFLKRTPLKQHSKEVLSDLPYYLLLGPSGAGKTSLLTNSGLKFILSKNQEHLNPLHIPSTEECDFWATKEAVLIDTGRDYTVHNHLGNKPKLIWQTLLRLLKKTRKKHAINGVILVIGLPDLERWTRNKKARNENNIRQRIEEINATFGNNTPVYLLFSKCDKIDGFQEFFSSLSRIERSQILGATFPLKMHTTKHFFATRFNDEFDSIIKRLSDRTIARLHQEYSPQSRAELLPFSWRFARYKTIIANFIQSTFDASDTEPGLNLRGAYFISSVQEINAEKTLNAQSTALQQHDLHSQLNPFKNYFIENVLRKVIFHEATSIYPEKRNTRNPLILQRAIYAACATVLLGSTVWWSMSLSHNLSLLNRAVYHLGQYQVLKLQLPADDISKVVPQIDQLAVLKQLTKKINLPWAMKYLMKSNVHNAASAAFYAALQNTFLPAVGRELAAQISDVANTDPQILIGAVTAYMMLAEPINLKPQFVEAWLKVYWDQSYPNQPDITSALEDYLRLALAGITQGIPINPDIVAVAEHVLTTQPTNLQPSNAIALASQSPLSNSTFATPSDTQQNPALFSAATLSALDNAQIGANAQPEIPKPQITQPQTITTAPDSTLQPPKPVEMIKVPTQQPTSTSIAAPSMPTHTVTAKNSKKKPVIQTPYGTITIENHG